MESKHELRLILKQDVITGFSYSFSRALLEFLSKRCLEETLYIGKEEEGKARKDLYNGVFEIYLVPEVRTALAYLAIQMHTQTVCSFAEISDLLDQAEEFLKIFEKK